MSAPTQATRAPRPKFAALAVLLVAGSLTGCDRMQAAFTPVPDKVNAAFPLADETELARSRLLAALDGDKSRQEATRSQFAQLMNARALACTAGNPIGRFDTVRRIKAKVTDTQCFTTQDAQLADWIGVRRMALALRAPALVPLAALPARALLPNTVDYFASAQLAAHANVLILRGQQQKVQALQVPSGKEISSFSVDGYGRPTLSPNGRLVAIPANKMVRVVEVESGKPVWSSDKYQDLVAFDPQAEAVVLAQAGTGAPFLLDLRSGRFDAYPSAEKRLTWSLPLDGGKLLVGNNASASLVQHTRGGNGALDVQALKQWTLPNGGNGTPFLMQQGKRLVVPTYRELAWIDLESGQQGSWQLSALNANGFAQVSDTLVAFDVTPTDGTGPAPRLLDVEKGTIAAAKDAGERGQVFPLAPRTGFLRRGPNATSLVTAAEGENPQDAERVIGEALAAREIAKLNDPYRNNFGLPGTSGRTPEQQAYIDALAKQVRAMNTQAAIRDGLPRATVEAIRRGELPVVTGGVPAPAPSGFPAQAPPMPGVPLPAAKTILDVPADARIAMIGVYQGSSNHAHSAPIRVRVGPGSGPIVLVLSSYEAVNWMVEPGNRKIAAVLLSGYKPSTVTGQGNAQVLRIGSTHAYKIESREFMDLRQQVARYVGNATPVFQGMYEGSEFQVQ